MSWSSSTQKDNVLILRNFWFLAPLPGEFGSGHTVLLLFNYPVINPRFVFYFPAHSRVRGGPSILVDAGAPVVCWCSSKARLHWTSSTVSVGKEERAVGYVADGSWDKAEAENLKMDLRNKELEFEVAEPEQKRNWDQGQEACSSGCFCYHGSWSFSSWAGQAPYHVLEVNRSSYLRFCVCLML